VSSAGGTAAGAVITGGGLAVGGLAGQGGFRFFPLNPKGKRGIMKPIKSSVIGLILWNGTGEIEDETEIAAHA